jgi:hypothetical protein
MRQFRMTTRRLMIAVAVVGVLLGAVPWGRRLMRRRELYLRFAEAYAQQEDLYRRYAAQSSPPEIWLNGRPVSAAEVVRILSERRRRYLHAAYWPWLLGPPATPPPDVFIREGGRITRLVPGNFHEMRKQEVDYAWESAYGYGGW